MKYTVKPNSCNCHPETCCCNDWVVFEDDHKLITCAALEHANTILEILNRGEQVIQNIADKRQALFDATEALQRILRVSKGYRLQSTLGTKTAKEFDAALDNLASRYPSEMLKFLNLYDLREDVKGEYFFNTRGMK